MPKYYDGLPAEIRIGPYAVPLLVVKKIDHKNPLGMWCGDWGPIKLREDQRSPNLAIDTLLHEIMHGIWTLSKLDTWQEEEIVEMMATWMVAVFVDNPKLLQWIIRSVLDCAKK